jgi:hypothetical protein
MGKYTQLKAKYPKVKLEGDYYEKVFAIKLTLIEKDDRELEAEYVKLRHVKEKLTQALTQVNAELEACEQLFVERFEGRGELNQKFEDGLTLYLIDTPDFQVTNEGHFYAWLREDPKHQEEFPLTVHSATLKSRLKARLEAGSPLPPGTELGYIKTGLGARGLPKQGE